VHPQVALLVLVLELVLEPRQERQLQRLLQPRKLSLLRNLQQDHDGASFSAGLQLLLLLT
jgi:hypothetical protein